MITRLTTKRWQKSFRNLFFRLLRKKIDLDAPDTTGYVFNLAAGAELKDLGHQQTELIIKGEDDD